jgi:hypothetical protein
MRAHDTVSKERESLSIATDSNQEEPSTRVPPLPKLKFLKIIEILTILGSSYYTRTYLRHDNKIIK